MTPSGIEPETFRFVAQHRNHCATAITNLTNQNKNYRNKLFPNTISMTNVNERTLNNSVHETRNRTDRHYLTISL